MVKHAVSLLVLSAALVACHAPPVSRLPGVRNGHSMVFDADRAVTVLVGGADARAVRDDVWLWDGRRWVEDPARGPGSRTFAAIAWDEARSEAVLFGGRRVLFGSEGEHDTCLADTWILKAGLWRRLDVAGPPLRTEAAIAYDARRSVVVLFGGYNDVGGVRTRLGDTWEWDGVRWTLRSEAGPEARSGATMTFDASRGATILFGGNGLRADTWVWDGVVWRELSTPATPGRYNSISAYDAARRVIVRSTGWDGAQRLSETWFFRDEAWLQAQGASPTPRNHSAMAYDRVRDRLVLFGGHDGSQIFGDVWEWDGGAWNLVLDQPAERRLENGH